MADISEFAGQVAGFFDTLQVSFATEPKLNRLALPLSRLAVEEFVRAAYYASLIPDEGRWPAAKLVCYPPGTSVDFHVLFDDPLPVSPGEIAKLAHAIDNRSHIACDIRDGVVRLAGFHVNRLATRRERGFNRGYDINSLSVTIKGPGYLEATTDVITLIYCGGDVTSNSPLTRAKTMERLLTRLRQKLHEGDFDQRLDSLSSLVNALVEAIVRLGHGGMVIFAADPKRPQFSSLRQTNCIFLHQLLIDYWNRMAEMVAATGGIEEWLKHPDTPAALEHRARVASTTDRLENCVQAIANLAGMDGAIVLTYDCKVGAFNAIIDRQDAPRIETTLLDVAGQVVDYKQTFSHRGSRHQSALFYARSVPDCFVFVVSQDGSISAFHNPNDGTVVCEFGLRAAE